MKQNPIVTKLKQKSTKVVTIKSEEYGDSEWTIRPLSTVELIERQEDLDNLPKNEALAGLTQEQLDDPTNQSEVVKSIRQTIIPMMRMIVPVCTINPRITTNNDDPDLNVPDANVLHLNDVPMDLLSQLFNEILQVSGIGKAAEEARKKLQIPTTPKELPPSVKPSQ